MKILKGDWKRANQFCRKMTRKTKYYKTCKHKNRGKQCKRKNTLTNQKTKFRPIFNGRNKRLL